MKSGLIVSALVILLIKRFVVTFLMFNTVNRC